MSHADFSQGFMPYQEFRGAEELTSHHQSGSRGHTRRSHAVLEARNFVAGYVKRNDPASRRFIQYLSMQTYRVLVLVRDGKTGEVLLSPPPDEMWLVREKSGLGRAVKNQWKVLKEVGPDFFEVIEKHRRWRLGFDDYYDVIMWDLSAGESFGNVYSTATQVSFSPSLQLDLNSHLIFSRHVRCFLKHIGFVTSKKTTNSWRPF